MTAMQSFDTVTCTLGFCTIPDTAAAAAEAYLLRDPLDYLPSVGFDIDDVQRSKRGIVERLRAHKPGLH